MPGDGLNQTFRAQRSKIPIEMTLETSSPARLSIGGVGNLDTIHFEQVFEDLSKIHSSHVDVDVKAVNLNA